MTDGPAAPAEMTIEVEALSHAGTERDHNEDAAGLVLERATRAVVAVADGVSGQEGGEVASRLAIEVLLRAFAEAPERLGAAERLYRAVQQANIEIYDRSIAVPELRGMATTLTAVVVDAGAATVVHVGDSRLYLLRGGNLTQLTRDHTVAAEKARYGLMSKGKARVHVDRGALTRSVGRELIVSRDRATHRLLDGDALLLCSDGLYNVLDDAELERTVRGRDPARACRALVEAANARGTPDNLTAAVVRVTGTGPAPVRPAGLAARVRRLLGR